MEVSITAIDFNEMKPEDVFKWIEQFSFTRHVLNHWMDYKKSEKFVEWMEDPTIEPGLCPSVIVPYYYHRKNIVILTEEMYDKIKTAFLRAVEETDE